MSNLPRVILITGTPGVGKTTICNLLEKKGYPVFRFNKFIITNGLYFGFDHTRDSVIVDEQIINKFLPKYLMDFSELVFVDGHTSNLINANIVSKVFVLRCNPGVLRSRLQQSRDYSSKKIEENVQAEIMEECLISAQNSFSKSKVVEIDTTFSSKIFVVEQILSLL